MIVQEQALIAMHAKGQNDPRWFELLDRLAERTGMPHDECEMRIMALAFGL